MGSRDARVGILPQVPSIRSVGILLIGRPKHSRHVGMPKPLKKFLKCAPRPNVLQTMGVVVDSSSPQVQKAALRARHDPADRFRRVFDEPGRAETAAA